MDPYVRIAELEAENRLLRERVTELEANLETLSGKVAELEKLLGRNSGNSSKPPSTDSGSAKNARPENANRAARRAMGRRQGKQPGTPPETVGPANSANNLDAFAYATSTAREAASSDRRSVRR